MVRLIEVKYCEDTRPGRQLEGSSKQHKILCRRLKAKKVILHTILLGVGGSIFNTLHHLKELGLDSQRIHKTALQLHTHIVHYAHKLKQFALKALVWSRGLPAILQIPTNELFHWWRLMVNLAEDQPHRFNNSRLSNTTK